MSKQIQDEFTGLKVSRQRKEQLRHPEREKAREKKWLSSESGKLARSAAQRRYYLKQKAKLKKEEESV